MIEVELPDGSIAEFDPGTPPDTIKAAVQKHISRSAANRYAGKDVGEVGTAMQALGGAKQTWDKYAMGLKDLFTDLTPEDKALLEEGKAFVKNTGPASTVGQIGGEIAMTAAPAAKAAKIFQRALPVAKSLAPWLATAGTSAASEALKAPDEGETRGENAMTGAVTGLVGQGVATVGGKAIGGIAQKSREAMALPPKVADEATLGQLADRKTVLGQAVSRAEEGLKSLPLVGSMISNARTRGVDAWRGDVLSKASPDGFTVPKTETTREAIEKIGNEFSTRYKAVLAGQPVKPLPAFEKRVMSVITDPKSGLLPAQQAEIKKLVDGYYENMFQITPQNPFGKAADAATAKDFEAFLTKMASNYKRASSSSPQAPAMAKALEDIEDAWTIAYRSQMPTQVRKALNPLDAKYAPFKTVERAASYVGNEGGDFTTSQLLNSVKARTTMPRFARSQGLLQKDAEAGKAVFGDKLPDSGTTERATLAAFGLGALLDPATAAMTAVAIPAIGTKTGRNAILGDTKLQLLLKKMRADKALEQSGMPITSVIQNSLDE